MVKNHPIWGAEDAQLLRDLRQGTQTDAAVFARMNAISLGQLRELEGDGEGGFYNNQIKSSTGLKLLRKLGHERVLAPEPATAGEALGVAASIRQAPPSTPVSTNTGVPNAPVTPNPSPENRPPTRGVNPAWMITPIVLGGLIWAASASPWDRWLRLVPDARSTAAATHPVAPVPATESATPGIGKAASPAPDEPQATTTPVPVQTGAAAPSGISESAAPGEDKAPACDAKYRQASFSYEPAAPLKAGNYIHFVAAQDISLCVRDRYNQLTDLRLKAGAAQSVYGTPPFLVHTSKWSDLQVFFQGRLVMGTPEGSAHWLFKHKDL